MLEARPVMLFRSFLKSLILLIERQPVLGLGALIGCGLFVWGLTTLLFSLLSALGWMLDKDFRYLVGLTGLLEFFVFAPLCLRCLDRILFFGRSEAGGFSLVVLKKLAGISEQ